MRRLFSLLVGFVVTVAPASAAPTGDARKSDLAKVARVVIQIVERHRGLRERTPIKVQIDRPETFRAGLRKRVDADTHDEGRERAEWLAFGIGQPGDSPAAIGKRAMVDSIAGYYDPEDKVLRVPSQQAGGLGEAANVLAHEVVHALQDQWWGIPDRTKLDGDASLALAALIEGDATLTTYAIGIAHAEGTPTPAALAEFASGLAALPTKVVLQLNGRSAELSKTPSLVREAMLFPYLTGAAFLAAIQRTGGRELVSGVHAARPTTTEQVMHPERYFLGEGAVPVKPVPLPPGETELARDVLGEFGVRAILQPCVGDALAEVAAEGWGGDAYLVSATAKSELHLRWVTTWDSEADAVEFADALARGAPSCWRGVTRKGAVAWSVADGVRVMRQGRHVIVTRGIEAEAPLFALVGARPALRPPIPGVTLTPAPEAELGRVPPPIVTGSTWTHAWLGLRGELPAGWRADFMRSSQTSFLTAPTGARRSCSRMRDGRSMRPSSTPSCASPIASRRGSCRSRRSPRRESPLA